MSLIVLFIIIFRTYRLCVMTFNIFRVYVPFQSIWLDCSVDAISTNFITVNVICKTETLRLDVERLWHFRCIYTHHTYKYELEYFCDRQWIALFPPPQPSFLSTHIRAAKKVELAQINERYNTAINGYDVKQAHKICPFFCHRRATRKTSANHILAHTHTHVNFKSTRYKLTINCPKSGANRLLCFEWPGLWVQKSWKSSTQRNVES